jgi:hypothetical protein
MKVNLVDVIGYRGERFFELAVTDYQNFARPLFRAGFLGDKWPGIDYYVELVDVPGKTPIFFAQIKSTANKLSANSISINLPLEKSKSLFKIPGPTYVVGVHEPTRRVFIRSVHLPPKKGIYTIPLKYELTPKNLKVLYDEVVMFWNSVPNKPLKSKFK